MTNATHPKEVGRAAYEVVAADINRRLGNPLVVGWGALSDEDRAAWVAAGHAEREAARAIPAHPTVEEALSAAASCVLDAAAWLERVDPKQHSEESKRVHEFLDMVADVLKQLPAPVASGQQPASSIQEALTPED